MKWQRLFCLLFAFCFIFSVPCSLSIYAYNVDGCDVVTKYSPVESFSTSTQFDTTITTSTTVSNFYIKSIITFPSPIADGSILDLSLNLDYSTTDSISYNALMYDVDNIQIGSFDGDVVNKKIKVDDIEVDGELSYIEFIFAINGATWTEHLIEDTPTTITFTFDGRSYTCERMMTWAEFCDSSYNPYNNFYYTDYGVYYVSTSKQVQVVSSGAFVKSTDRIFEIAYDYDVSVATAQYDIDLATTVEYTYNFTVTGVNYEIQEGEKLLGGILGWIKNIFNSITNLPQKFANAIKGFFDNVVNAIKDLGQSILDGIVGLFVPTEDDITAIKGRFESLLADRFGAVYDSTQIIDDFANAFNSQSQSAMIDGTGASGVISFPSITVDLVGVPFTFGGWDVDIIPDKFEGIIDTLKMITNICCTFVFVNGMRKRLDGVLK